MAVIGPMARALAAEIADTVTFAMAPDEPRDAVVQRIRDFHTNRDVELSMHIPVVGNSVWPFMAPPDTDASALRSADSLAYLPPDPQRPPTSCAVDARRPASPTSPSAPTSPTRSPPSSLSCPAGSSRWRDPSLGHGLRSVAWTTPSGV